MTSDGQPEDSDDFPEWEEEGLIIHEDELCPSCERFGPPVEGCDH